MIASFPPSFTKGVNGVDLVLLGPRYGQSLFWDVPSVGIWTVSIVTMALQNIRNAIPHLDFCLFFETRLHCIVRADLEFMPLFLQSPECGGDEAVWEPAVKAEAEHQASWLGSSLSILTTLLFFLLPATRFHDFHNTSFSSLAFFTSNFRSLDTIISFSSWQITHAHCVSFDTFPDFYFTPLMPAS